MSENITIARPYAKAIFNIAKNNDTLGDWDQLLSFWSAIIKNDSVVSFVKNRTISYSDKLLVIIKILDFCDILDKEIYFLCVNFIDVLLYYGRFVFIEDIYTLYKQFMNLDLGCMEVSVETASVITNIEKERIIYYLSKRFGKKMLVLFEVDEKLLGGFLVRSGDFVFDASIAGNLVSLRTKIMM